MDQLDDLTKVEKQVYHLVKGSFSPEEALEIIINLISGKINFHTLRNFSLKERTGQNDEYSLNRITELNKDAARFRDMVHQAYQKSQRLVISSEILVELTDDNKTAY